jgi:hypothetical protein
MADKVDKPKKKAKAKKDDKGVLAALPSTRHERIGTRRRGAAAAPKRTTATAKRPAVAKAPTAANPSTAAKKPAAARATAARRKAAAPRTFEPTQAAESAAGAVDERAAGPVPLAETPRKPPRERPSARPRPVSEGAPGIGTPADARTPASAGGGDERSETGSSESARPSGVELATTAVKAAGEVAQLSVAIGGHVLKRVVGRLPRP